MAERVVDASSQGGLYDVSNPAQTTEALPARFARFPAPLVSWYALCARRTCGGRDAQGVPAGHNPTRFPIASW